MHLGRVGSHAHECMQHGVLALLSSQLPVSTSLELVNTALCVTYADHFWTSFVEEIS